jgi:hypothetical protein
MPLEGIKLLSRISLYYPVPLRSHLAPSNPSLFSLPNHLLYTQHATYKQHIIPIPLGAACIVSFSLELVSLSAFGLDMVSKDQVCCSGAKSGLHSLNHMQ